MRKIKLVILLSFASLVLNGCLAVKDEGEIDYRKTIPTSTEAPISILHKKFKDSDNIIQEGENISIHLAGGFSLGTTEVPEFQEIFHPTGASAEYAVIAKVCEIGKSGCGDFFSSKSDNSGRVVYFTDSLKAKQFFNFSYLPIYGPIKYEGGPLMIQVHAIELDISSPSQKKLFSSLANLGKDYYAPASKVLSALETLGSTLTTSTNGNDSIFRHTFTFMPENHLSSTPSPKYPTLSKGNYVFLKKPTVAGKQEEFIWDRVKIDNETGKLVQNCKANHEKIYVNSSAENGETITKGYDVCDDSLKEKNKDSVKGIKEYREHTYFTLQVQSGFKATGLNNQQTLANLIQELSTIKSTEFDNYDDVIKKYTKDLAQDTMFHELQSSLSKIKKINTKINEKEQQKVELTNNNKTEQVNGLTKEIESNKDKRALKANNFIDLYKKSIQDYIECTLETTNTTSCNKKSTLNQQQLTKLIIELRSILRTMKNDIKGKELDEIAPLKITTSFALKEDELKALLIPLTNND